MKRTFYLIITLMLAISITGCSLNSSKNTENTKKTEEKTSKKENKKEDSKKEDSKKEENEETISTVDNILTCEMESDNYNGTVDIAWVDGALKDIEFKINVLLNDPSITDEAFDATAELTKQMMIAQYGINENTAGITLTTDTNKETKSIIFNIYMDLTKADKDVLSKLGLNISDKDLKASIDDIKASMEQSGFACQKKYN